MGSSGGSAFAAFHDIITAAYPGRHHFAAVSDRASGFEDVCEERGIPLLRARGADNDAISKEAAGFLASELAPDLVVLYLLRLVTEAIYNRFATFNIHPSILPAYRGFDSLARAHADGARFFGTTLHQVDGGIDTGPIVAQMVAPATSSMAREEMEMMSYLQKVYCALLLVDLAECGTLVIEGARARLSGDYVATDRSNPALSEGPLLDGFRELQRATNAEVVP
jgi:phosphoribosylglycinamide formyltransferase-1